MKRLSRTILLSTVLLGSGSLPAASQGVPVIDATAIAQFALQLDQMRQDFENQIEQLTSLQAQLDAITGSRGFGSLLNSAADQTARGAADSLRGIMDSAVSGGSLPGLNTSALSGRIDELKTVFGLDNLSDFLNSSLPQDRGVATQAGSGLAAVATAEDTYQRANAAMERVNGLIGDIDTASDLKAAIDYNTRMLGEMAVIMNELLRVQASVANTVGTDAVTAARDRAAQRKFMTGATQR